jgi:hypothetical protein
MLKYAILLSSSNNHLSCEYMYSLTTFIKGRNIMDRVMSLHEILDEAIRKNSRE